VSSYTNCNTTLLHFQAFALIILVPNSKEESLLTPSKNSDSLGLILGSVFGTAVVLLFSLIVVYKIRKNTATVLTKEDIDEFMNGIVSIHEKDQVDQFSMSYACKPYNKDKEVDFKDYIIGW